MLWHMTTLLVGTSTEDYAEGTDAETLPDIELSSNGSAAYVIPVGIEWTELFEGTGLHEVDICRQLDLK